MTSLTFYGGVDEIGGNKILLETDKSAIFLDFGKSFRLENSFYNPPYFENWNTFDLMKIGALPPLNIYDWPTPGECKIPTTEKKIDGFFITHPHEDHYGYIPELSENRPVFAGEASALLMKVRATQGQTAWEKKFKCQFNTFSSGMEIDVPDMQVIPHSVDHSVPGAYGFIISIGNKTIAYTGDFRMHGVCADLTEKFLKAAEREGVDVLICEGTRLARDEDAFLKFFEHQYNQQFGKTPKRKRIPVATETEVETKMTDLIKQSEDLVFVETGVADVDRIRTIFNATKKSGRKLILQDKQAYICFSLGCVCDELKSFYDAPTDKKSFIEGLPSPKDVHVFFKRSKVANEYKEKRGHFKWQTQHIGEFWDAECIWGETSTDDSIGREDLRKNASDYVLCTHYAGPMFQELYDGKFNDITYILSKSEPFNEEMVISFTAWNSWMRLLDIDEYYQLHVSGHCSPEQLKEAVSRINAEVVYPVHTEHQDLFKGFTKNVVPTQRGKKYEL